MARRLRGQDRGGAGLGSPLRDGELSAQARVPRPAPVRRPDLVIAFLDGSHELIAERQSHRHHEYMPTSLLDSQFATLERPEPDETAVAVSIDGSVDDTVATITSALSVTSG